MKNIISRLIVLVALTTIYSQTTYSQNTVSGYFVEQYTYRTDLNPAFGLDKNYVAMPVLGNLNIGLQGNLNLTDVIYNIDGQTTTFLNPKIETSDFLNKIDNNNKISLNLRIPVISAGFKAFNGYNTVGINIRSNVGFAIPKAIFQLAKEGIGNKTYDITNFDIHSDAYAEIALGHSHQINDQWRVGGAFKFLVGAANLDAGFQRAQLQLGEDKWNAITNATINASVKGISYEHDTDDNGNEYVSGVETDKFGIGGFGMALDLGGVFTLNKDWQFSASILDLGFINWAENHQASTNGDKTFTTDKYSFNVDDDAINNFDDELDKMVDDLATLYQLTDNGNVGSRTRMLGLILNFAARYTLPVYDKLNFGLLNSTQIRGKHTWTDFRLSANVAPVKMFSAGINLGVGTFGTSFGWLINLHTTGFNFFVGMDRTLSKLAKQGVPLSSNAHVNLGINFLF